MNSTTRISFEISLILISDINEINHLPDLFGMTHARKNPAKYSRSCIQLTEKEGAATDHVKSKLQHDPEIESTDICLEGSHSRSATHGNLE